MTANTPAGAPLANAAERNRRPVRTTIGIALSAMIVTMILAVALGSSRPQAPDALGRLYANAFFGFVALGFWAKRARQRWTPLGWAWRCLLCVVLSMVVTGALSSFGNAASLSR